MSISREMAVTLALSILESSDDCSGEGICLACGAIGRHGSYVEPDAREYTCDQCERRAVYGAEEVLIMNA